MTDSEKVQTAVDALSKIAWPLLAMQKTAEAAGLYLDGKMALQIVDSPEYLSSIAREALAKIHAPQTPR